ncbi:MAG: dihydrolipoyl dehydrogenase [Bacteroidales bacterium]
MNYDLAIIGAGPAGYTGAEQAAKAGLSVILFEKEQIGGVCLNWGCIPTKTLLYSAKTYDHIRSAEKYGVSVSGFAYDLPKIISRKNKIIRKLTAGIRARLKAQEVTIVAGKAEVNGSKGGVFEIACAEETYQAKRLLLATGSETFVPPIPGIGEVPYWTSTEALDSKEVPESLLIVGGGVIGMEFASFFNSMGSKVTVVEMLDEILGGIDHEISALLREEYRKKGVEFFLSAKVTAFEGNKARFLHEGEEKEVTFDKVLMAAGRRPVLDSAVIANLNPAFDGRFIRVNEQMQTSVPNVYACGDITGRSMLAHTAEREANVAVHTMIGIDDAMSYRAIPGVVYTSPEVSSVGASEEELKQKGIPYVVKKLPMSYSGRFVVENEAGNGLCKLLIGDDEAILGAHVIGSPSSEFIVAAGMAIQNALSAEEWARTVFPHPTVSEIFKECLHA